MARYKYTQESGTDFKVNTANKADALEDSNEVRQILDDLGELLGHSKFDDAYPKDGSAGGTLAITTQLHTQGTDQGLDTGGANAVVVADVKDAVTKKHTQNADTDLDAAFKATLGGYSNIVKCADYDHPDDAITALGADNKTLIVTEAETCDVNVIVPVNVKVRFERGGKWTIATGVTVTFNGQFDAGLWEIFTCTGTGAVVLNSGSTPEAYPEWWGAKGDGTTDDAAIFNSVLTQLNASKVRTMVLNSDSYLITDTIILYSGMSIIGKNNYPSTLTEGGITQPAQTKIVFSPASEKDLFDITQTGAYTYITKVYLGGMNLYGNTTGGVTYSRYAINSKAAQSVFENLGIEFFQDGIYCNYTMTNKYRDIYIGNCSHACIYTSTSQNTTDIFDNVIMRDSPWGAILRNSYAFKFVNCLFESLTLGGVNIYKEGCDNEFLSTYSENTPSTSDDYAMFYIKHDGTTTREGKTVINGGYFYATHGSFLDVNYTNYSSYLSVMNTSIYWFVNGIKASAANTLVNSIYLAGNRFYYVTNVWVNTHGKLHSEEGEWTMGVSFSNGGGNPCTYSANTGYYTKIGNIVTISGTLTLTSKGTDTGNALITGLPFTLVNNPAGAIAVMLQLASITFANQYYGTILQNTTSIILNEATEAGVGTALTNADFADNSLIRLSCTYRCQ